MKLKKGFVLSMLMSICMLAAMLSSCTSGKEPAASHPSQETSSESSAQPSSEPSGSEANTGALYISLGGEEYTRYPYNGENTPEGLLQAIEELTGWKLSLADEITDGKGGMTVVFAKDACLFTGPPEEQKDQFHVYDAAQFYLAVLDSVQKTLQCWASPTNPDSVDIYFGMEGDQGLELNGVGVTWPLDRPYSHVGLLEMMEQ